MQQINVLKEQRAGAKTAHDALISQLVAAAAADESGPRGLSDADKGQIAASENGVTGLDELIDVEQRRLDVEIATRSTAGVSSSAPSVTVSAPNLTEDPYRGFRHEGDFAMGDFALAVKNACRPGGQVDPRLVEGGLMQAGGMMAAPTNFHKESGATEGAMVPPQVAQGVRDLVFEDPILQQLSVEPTNSNVVEFSADETTPWGATGIQANWRAEGAQMTETKLVTDPRQLRVYELYAFVTSSEELDSDAPRLADRLNVKAPAAIRWKAVEAFMFGTGVGQPLGFAAANYAGKVATARTTASNVKPADLDNMFSRMLVQDGPDNTFWVMNRNVFPNLRANSTLGDTPIWLPGDGMAGTPNGTVLGRPLFYSEHCETMGTIGDVIFVNPAGYYAVQRTGITQAFSMHLFFDYGVNAYRWMFRFGGTPYLEDVVTAPKGATKSAFLLIAT